VSEKQPASGRWRPGNGATRGRRCRFRLWPLRKPRHRTNWNSYLGRSPNWRTTVKRTEREIDNARKFAIERFAQELVTGVTRWRRQCGRCSQSRSRPVGRGRRATLRQLQRAFDKAASRYDPAGQPFDPAWHEP